VLRQAAKWLGKPFRKASRGDIERLIAQVERMPYSEWTRASFRIAVKKFYKWLLGKDEEYPPQVKWIRGNIPPDRVPRPRKSDLLVEEEVQQLLKKAANVRDQAYIAVLWDSGGRIGEIGTPAIHDVTSDKYGYIIQVHGKTGARPIRLIQSTPYLARWLDQHPRRDDPEAPLWVSTSNMNRGRPLGYAALRKILRVTFQRAGIAKKSNPHSFRHARATDLAKHLTEFQMNQRFGWTQGSDMPRTYVHLSGRDTDEAMLRLHGIHVEEEDVAKRLLQPRVCPRCDTLNTSDAKFCRKCGTAIELGAVLHAEQQTREAEGLLAEILKDDIVQQAIQGAFLKLKLKKPASLTQVKAPAE
jgi:integrase/ribosomal protein L40E